MSKELIERLEKAESGSRELDSAIVELLQLAPEGAMRMHGVEHGTWATGPYETWVCPKLTTSLDAALALVERVLPADPDFRPATPSAGWKIDIYRGMVPTADGGGWFVTVRQHATDGFQSAKSSPALALCIAILKAQGAQQ